MARKLNWGILGTGMIARVLAEGIAASETGVLAAIGSRSQKNADEFGKQFHVPRCYGSYEQVLSDPGVEAVYISLPNHLHAEWTIRCAEAGKHVLCEKPLSVNFGQAMAMVEAARRHGILLMEAFMYRVHPQTDKICQLIREGAIGDVRMIEAAFCYNWDGMPKDNIRMLSSAAGGAIMDIGCYCLSMARLIAGAASGKTVAEPVDLKGVAHIGTESKVDEWAAATLRFPGDILANLSAATQLSISRGLNVWGSKGSIAVANPWKPDVAPESATIELNAGGKVEKIVASSPRPLYANQVDVFARHLEQKQVPMMSLDDSLNQAKALDRWRREVGLTFEAEKRPALDRTLTGRPLAPRAKHKMKYGKIEGIDKPVSRLVMGTMVFGGNQPYTNALLDFYFENGGTTLDTALVYGSEAVIGAWVNMRGVREQIVFIAKGGCDLEVTPKMLEENLTQSLERTGQDYFDLYMMHRDNVDLPVGEFVDYLDEQKRKGRIRSYGGSNWSAQRLQAANDYAARHGKMKFVASSPHFSLAHWNEPMWEGCSNATPDGDRAWYTKTRMPLLAWSSQANGFFTGRFSAADKGKAEVREIERVWFNEGNFERLRRVNELAAKKKVTPVQISLAYVLCQPMDMYALIGPATFDEYRSSAGALDVELTADELAWLDLKK